MDCRKVLIATQTFGGILAVSTYAASAWIVISTAHYEATKVCNGWTSNPLPANYTLANYIESSSKQTFCDTSIPLMDAALGYIFAKILYSTVFGIPDICGGMIGACNSCLAFIYPEMLAGAIVRQPFPNSPNQGDQEI